MVSNKKRLYVALYPSGTSKNVEPRYHWAFLIGPKGEKEDPTAGRHFHVKNTSAAGWTYEESNIENVKNTNTLLARILIAKIEDEQRLVEILRNVALIQGDPKWRCMTWIANALRDIQTDGTVTGTAELRWEKIEPFARDYVRRKTAAGRYKTAADLVGPKPTWDIIRDKELVQ